MNKTNPFAAYSRELMDCALGVAEAAGFETDAERLAFACSWASGFTTAIVFGNPSDEGRASLRDPEALGAYLRRETRKALRRMQDAGSESE